MSRITPFLQRRGGALHFRIAVPADLRQQLNTAEITCTLGTGDRSVALPFALELAAKVKRAYSQLRAGAFMDLQKLQALIREKKVRLELDDERERHWSELVELQRQHAAALELARLEAANEALRSVAGFGTLAAPVPPPVPATPAKALPAAPSFQKVVNTFLEKSSKTTGKAMHKKHEAVLPLLLAAVGDKPLDQIKQADLNGFFELVGNLPPRWADTCRKRKINPIELAALKEGQLAPKTFEDTYKASVRMFLKGARRDWQDEGFPVHLSVEGIAYAGDVGGGMNKQRAFRREELRRLFDAIAAAGYKADVNTAHKHWLPYIGLYTGARVNEICQLNPATDIVREARTGIWHLRFTEETEGDARVAKSIKNNQSVRKVPIHSKLIEAGFLDYVADQKKRASKLLFPAWTPTRGRASPAAERWFREFLRDLGLRDETPGARLVGMHAFRHLILHRAFNARPPLDVTAITGHADDAGSVVAGYRGEMSLENKRNILERVDFSF